MAETVNLLGWHGTVLRVDGATGAWFHAMPWPEVDGATDLAIDLPDTGLQHPMQLDWFVVEPHQSRQWLHLRRQGLYLTAHPPLPFVHFASDLAGPLETFLPITPSMLARLRAILAAPARLGQTSALVRVQCGDGFELRIGARTTPIATAMPHGETGLTLQTSAAKLDLTPAPNRAPPGRTEIPRDQAVMVPASNQTEFAPGHGSTLVIASAQDTAYPPITLTDADQIWMQRRPWWPHRQSWGATPRQFEIGRASNAFVLASHGTVFDRHANFTDRLYLDSITVQGQPPLSRHGGRVFVDTKALDDAPFLPGPHVLFFGGIVSNYFHWLIEALLPLHAMAPHLPPDTKLLFPAALETMREDTGNALTPPHEAMLQDWGFADMPRAIVNAPLCRVEHIIFPRDVNLDAMPASLLIAARAHLWRRLAEFERPDPQPRIYIRRPGKRRVHNAAEIEHAVTQLGFTVLEMPALTPRAQMAVFSQAEFVIAPHGADLSNLLFCPAGTRVIELSPDAQFRFFFAQIADKLGLSHAVLPCPTLDGGFDSDLHVDPARLLRLIDVMQARLP